MTVLILDALSSVSEQAREKAQKSATDFASWTLWDCSVDQSLRDFGNSNLLATFRVGTPSLE